MAEAKPVTVAYGDGIGPEIMEATLSILNEAKANLAVETIEVGEKQYKTGNTSGIPASAWESLRRTNILLKAPITTPQGGGYKSLNVTMRKTLGLYANVRPCVCYHPFVKTNHPKMDLVIVRENEEDLYAGMEYQLTHDAVHSVKLITRSGSERIIRYAFEYAVQNGRKKVTCMSKDNIMKIADGMFHKIFNMVGEEYPQIEKEHYIIDIGTARIASAPERFDVIVTENLYGDIISDVAADVSGSVGLAGSSNVGNSFAMFEAIHGSAPDIAGKDIANPSGLLNAAIMMLVHIGQPEVASLVHNAWAVTIESGIHTADIFNPTSKRKVGTREFAQAVISHLGESPRALKAAKFHAPSKTQPAHQEKLLSAEEKRTLTGVDVFIHWTGDIDIAAKKLKELAAGSGLDLHNIANKGLKVWPDYVPGMNLTDQFNCRFKKTGEMLQHKDVAALLAKIAASDIEFLKIENLYEYGAWLGYTLGQGE
ncbi:MAG TPA: NADP-dependent isocitrate dehydrogenase [Rickettsiales bacterium]|nr:NADP-dependent isocitrate dehydrogenase [Rickettsiales bacterium]